MERGIIRPAEYRDHLWSIANESGSKLRDIIFVASVNDWAKERGLGEKNRISPRCARTFDVIGSDEWVIVLATELTPRMRQSVLENLAARGYDISPISSDISFLTHLFLHEIGHTRKRCASEDECDDWAFKELPKYAV